MDRLTQPDPIRIFVNAKGVDAHPGDTVLDAIDRWDATLATTLRDGSRALADSRGIVTSLDTPVHGGAIFRVVSNRQEHTSEHTSEHDTDQADGAEG